MLVGLNLGQAAPAWMASAAADVVGVDWERCRDEGDVMLTLEIAVKNKRNVGVGM